MLWIFAFATLIKSAAGDGPRQAEPIVISEVSFTSPVMEGIKFIELKCTRLKKQCSLENYALLVVAGCTQGTNDDPDMVPELLFFMKFPEGDSFKGLRTVGSRDIPGTFYKLCLYNMYNFLINLCLYVFTPWT
jgi:hypothetical protein